MFLELTVHSHEKERDILYIIHALQLAADSAYIEHEFEKFVSIKANSDNNEFVFPVKVRWILSIIIYYLGIFTNGLSLPY